MWNEEEKIIKKNTRVSEEIFIPEYYLWTVGVPIGYDVIIQVYESHT